MNLSSRPYASPLRQEQAEQTRQRIVDTTARLIVGGVDGVSMPQVAEAAGVGLRTVFRHFATREALLDATWVMLNEQIGVPPALDSLDELLAFIPELFARYAAIEGQIRAVIFSSILKDSRQRIGSPRRARFMAAVEALTVGVPEASRTMVRAAIYLNTIPVAFLMLKDNYKLTTEEAAASAAWSVRTLVLAAATDPPRPATQPSAKEPIP